MAQQKTERMDKAVRDEMMGLLKERVANPKLVLDVSYLTPGFVNPPHSLRTVAAAQLWGAKYVNNLGLITLAGMDYYRRETANPVPTWLRSNWFAVIVAGCTIGVSVWGIVGG